MATDMDPKAETRLPIQALSSRVVLALSRYKLSIMQNQCAQTPALMLLSNSNVEWRSKRYLLYRVNFIVKLKLSDSILTDVAYLQTSNKMPKGSVGDHFNKAVTILSKKIAFHSSVAASLSSIGPS